MQRSQTLRNQMQPNAITRCPMSTTMLPCGQSASSETQRFLKYAACAAPVQQMQPTSSQIHPPGGKYQPLCNPVASQPAAICSVYCNMLHMQRLCSQMQPTGSQIHPPDVQYHPVCYPLANQTAPHATLPAICFICNTIVS